MNKTAVLSGDMRQAYVHQYLVSQNFESELKSNMDFAGFKYIVCGTPFSKDAKNINCDFYTGFPIDTFWGLLKPGQIVFGGNIPDISPAKITVCDVLKDEFVLYNNAVLTAEGLISKIISSTTFALSDSKALILGFGRCGFIIAEKMSRLGCGVTVHDNKYNRVCLARSLGYNALEYAHLGVNIHQFDIIINTVPCGILMDFHMSHIKKGCVLFEIASKPYGFSDELVKKYNLSLITCPGLPGRFAPKAAGELIAKSIISYVERTGINGL